MTEGRIYEKAVKLKPDRRVPRNSASSDSRRFVGIDSIGLDSIPRNYDPTGLLPSRQRAHCFERDISRLQLKEGEREDADVHSSLEAARRRLAESA